MVSATIRRTAKIPEEQKKNQRYQDDSLGQVVEHGVRGVVNQIAAVEKRNDLHAARQDDAVQLFRFRFDGLERGLRLGALASAARYLPPRRRCR